MEHEIHNFRDSSIGNGDPIVVYNAQTNEAHTLGTGFHSFEDVRREIERSFDVEDGDSFDIFSVDARVDFSDSNETLNTVATE